MALGLGSVIDRPRIEVEYDDSEVDRGLRNTESKTKRGFGSIGKAAALGAAAGFAALGYATKQFADEAMEAQKVAAQTNAVIKSTGGIANVSAKDVDRLSESLMRKSGVDDEVIKSGANMLLTFTNVRNEVGRGNDIFNQATSTLLDMTTALGGDPQKAAIQLGKALNDPIAGITALQRVGVTFTKQQKEMVKGWVANGETMRAQKFILAELNKEFGGSAEAAGQTLAGQLSLLKNEALNMGSALLTGLLPHLTSFTKMVTGALPRIFEFAGGLREGIARGIRSVSDAVTGGGMSLGDYWAKFKEGLSLVWGILRTFIAWWVDTFGPVIRQALDVVRANLDTLRQSFEENRAKIDNIIQGMKTVLEGVAWILKNVLLPAAQLFFKHVLVPLIEAAITWIDRFATVVRGIDRAVNYIREHFRTFWTWLQENALRAALAVVEPFSHLPGKMGKWARDAKGEIEKELDKIEAKKVVDKIAADMNSKTPSIEEVGRRQGEAWRKKFLGSATPSLDALTGAAGGNGDGVISALPQPVMATNPGGLRPYILDELGLAQQMGLRLTSGYRAGSITSTGNVSLHSVGGAIDVAGSHAQMAAFARMAAGRPGVAEVIYTPVGAWYPGAGWTRPTGSVAADHYDHVHVGARGDGLVGAFNTPTRRFTGDGNIGIGGTGSLQALRQRNRRPSRRLTPMEKLGLGGAYGWWLTGHGALPTIRKKPSGTEDVPGPEIPPSPGWNPDSPVNETALQFDLDFSGDVDGDDAKIFAAQFGMEALWPHEIEARIQKRLLQEQGAILGVRSRFMRDFAPDIFRSSVDGLRFGSEATRQGPTVVFNFQRAPEDPYTWIRAAQKQVEAAMS